MCFFKIIKWHFFLKRCGISCFVRMYSVQSPKVLETTKTNSHVPPSKSPRCYKTLFPWNNFDEFSTFLTSCVTHYKGGLIVLNKPFGIKVNSHDKPGARPAGEHQFIKPNVPECNYTIEDALPVLQKHLDVPNLSIVKSAEKYTSGVVLLSSSDKITAKIVKSFNIAKFQHKPHLIHWAVTSGYPTIPYRKEKVGIKFTETDSGMKQPVIETDISKRSCKLKKVYSVNVESRTISVNKELSTSLVEIASSGVKWHFVRVYASTRVAPILGDVLYGARMKSFLGIPVKAQLSHPSTSGYEPLPKKICEKLNLPHGSIGQLMIPTMLHLRSILLPNFEEKEKDFIVTVDLPKHFQWTVNQLNLLINYK